MAVIRNLDHTSWTWTTIAWIESALVFYLSSIHIHVCESERNKAAHDTNGRPNPIRVQIGWATRAKEAAFGPEKRRAHLKSPHWVPLKTTKNLTRSCSEETVFCSVSQLGRHHEQKTAYWLTVNSKSLYTSLKINKSNKKQPISFQIRLVMKPLNPFCHCLSDA